MIYGPIQFINGFNISEDYISDFILLSSSQMTTHMFMLKTQDEILYEKQLQSQKWSITTLFQSTKETSKVKLMVQD